MKLSTIRFEKSPSTISNIFEIGHTHTYESFLSNHILLNGRMAIITLFICCAAKSFPGQNCYVNAVLPSQVRAPKSSNNHYKKSRIVKIEPINEGNNVDIQFSDIPGLAYRFHSLWLRDACRDSNHVVSGGVGERILTATPVAPTCQLSKLRAISTSIEEHNRTVEVFWNNVSSTKSSVFDFEFLRQYSDIVAKKVVTEHKSNGHHQPVIGKGGQATSCYDISWLKPYTGYSDAPGPSTDDIHLWSNLDELGSKVEFPTFNHDEVLGNATSNLQVLKALVDIGVVMINSVPLSMESDSASSLKHFMDRAFGGLQKDHSRDEPNWEITQKVGATSISYDHDKFLNGHTDQSVPPNGLPGIVLSINYVTGKGANTLVDGFPIAEKIRQIDPEAFDLLCRYEYSAERDFIGSRADSAQKHFRSLIVLRKNKIFETDDENRMKKIMYNEVFRLPVALPYELFPKWFAALALFNSLINDPDFKRTIPMQQGSMLLMNNWRVLHGRAAGMASVDRKIVGGTITRESFFSKAIELVKEVDGHELPRSALLA